MYSLTYYRGDVKAVAKNKDVKVLRTIINCLDKKDAWELKNCGGIVLDNSFEHFKGLPIKK